MSNKRVIKKVVPIILLATIVTAYMMHSYKDQQLIVHNRKRLFLTEISLEKLSAIKYKSSFQYFLLKQKKNKWMIELPVKDFVSLSFLGLLESTLKKQELEAVQEISDQEAGWNQPWLHLDLIAPSESDLETLKIIVGSKKTFNNKTYIQVNGKKYIGSADWEFLIGFGLKDIRLKRIFNQAGQADQINFSIKGQKPWGMQYQNKKWSFTSPLKGVINIKYLQDFRKMLMNAEWQNTITDRVDQNWLKKMGLQQPRGQIELLKQNKTLLRFRFSDVINKQVYVHIEGSSRIYEFSEQMIKHWVKSKADFEKSSQKNNQAKKQEQQ